MKIKIYISIIFLSVCTYSNAQKFKNASEYLDFVGKEQTSISKSMWNYTKAVAHSKNDRTIRGRRNVIIKTVERAILKINKAPGYDGDDYKNKVLTQLNFNLNLLNHDYAKIIDMKEVAEQSYDAMEAYMLAQELADKKMEEAQQQYESDFYAFAAKHDISIIETDSDLGKKMEISNKVFKHYNEIYLSYFKVYINEVYLTGDLALGKQSDVVSLILIGKPDQLYLVQLIQKVESLIPKRIQYLIYSKEEAASLELNSKKNLLLWHE